MATATDLRRAVSALASHANGDLSRLWVQLETATAAGTALRDLLPGIVDTYGTAAATVAADWYNDLRAKQGIAGAFLADPVDIPQSGTQALIGWALAEAQDYPSFQTLIEGGAQRRIANFSRITLTSSSTADPQARGWQRTGSGECDFCEMLIGRGAVYTEATADFAAHDHCKCQAVPAWGGQPLPVRPFTPSPRQNPADRARARAWIAEHL